MSEARLARLRADNEPIGDHLSGLTADEVGELLAEVERLREVEAAHRELIAPHGPGVPGAQLVTMSAHAKKIAEKRDALGKLAEACREVDRLRAQLAEIGETREEWGVRVDGCTDTIGVYPGRESAEENLALWRKVWPSSEFTLMQRENRAAVVSGWREVPDA